MTTTDRAEAILVAAECICEFDREELYMALTRSCAAFALSCRDEARILEMMIEALQVGLDAVRGAIKRRGELPS